MADHAENVKQLADRIKQSYQFALEEGRSDEAGRHKARADGLYAAAAHIERLESLTKPLPQTLGDLSDLPPELVKELNVSKTDEMEDQIFTVINAYGGEADLDQILVGLFRKFAAVQKRRFVQNKLYKMIKSEMIWPVEGKKGVYASTKPSPTQLPEIKASSFVIDTGDPEEDDISASSGLKRQPRGAYPTNGLPPLNSDKEEPDIPF